MSYEVADVLDDAADYIEKHGWCQGRHVAPDGRVCAVEALNRVSCDGPLQRNAQIALIDVTGASWIAAWNDREGRTQAEVLGAFRLAAKQERIAADAGES